MEAIPTLALLASQAAAASRELSGWSGVRRRDAVHRIADALEGAADVIVATAAEETGLGTARLESELARTNGQLRFYGDFVAEGRDRPVATDEKVAAGGADVVLVQIPVGPVAVFAASNFPLAFGVLGTDTASALAAGCPVVVKAHPAQPRTADLLADLATEALAAAGAPDGTFALVHGGADVSLALVQTPEIRAVGFTGSLSGGRALMDASAARPDPIPVFAEMGSVNPVFVLPSALTDDSWPGTIASAVTGSAGQLCTKPGLVFVPDTEAGGDFADRLAAAVAATTAPDRMLTPGMSAAHGAWLGRAGELGKVQAGEGAVVPFTVRVSADQLGPELLTEHFGPALVICLAPVDLYGALVDRLEGSLTATVIADEADDSTVRELLPALATVAGRIILNGVPTGVAVTDAMHHGGPWPAASLSSFTSVGTGAIGRFLRPLALQGMPRRLTGAFRPE